MAAVVEADRLAAVGIEVETCEQGAAVGFGSFGIIYVGQVVPLGSPTSQRIRIDVPR